MLALLQRELRADGAHWAWMQELVHEEDFDDRLQAMLADPEGKDSITFLNKIMRFVSLVGKRVPFGPVERSSAMTTIIGLARTFGAPSLYLTVAPNDVLNPTMLRLCFRVAKNESWPATDAMPDGRSFNERLGEDRQYIVFVCVTGALVAVQNCIT
jgi:hypothetical protein